MMTINMDQKVIKALRDLYKSDDAARRLFDLLVERERDASTTSLDRLTQLLSISRKEAVSLSKCLERAGCGQLIVGRRGHKSRFAWSYSCISLGQVATGETTELEEPENPLPEAEEEAGTLERGAYPARMNIAEAKQALSRSLGVPESAIEILIRA